MGALRIGENPVRTLKALLYVTRIPVEKLRYIMLKSINGHNLFGLSGVVFLNLLFGNDSLNDNFEF